MSSNHMQSGFAGLKLLVLLGVAVMASSGLYMSIQSAYTPNQEYSVIYYHHGLAKTNEVKAEVLGVSIAKPVQTPLPTSQIQALIDKTLQKYIDSGKFVGPQGPQGPAGQGVVQGTNFQSTAIISGTPIVSYIQAASNSNSISGNVAGFTQLSASSLSVGNTATFNNLTVTGSYLFAGGTFAGTATFAGTVDISGNSSTTPQLILESGSYLKSLTPGAFENANGALWFTGNDSYRQQLNSRIAPTVAITSLTTWTGWPSANDSNNWEQVVWSPELKLFVAVASSGANRVMTSPDGINWTLRPSANDSMSWLGIVWSPQLGLFVSVASAGTGNRVMTSPDGINWTSRASSNDTNSWAGVVWSPDLRIFVAVANFGTNKVMTSPDGINWTGHTSAFESGGWSGITWSPQLSLFVSVSGFGAGVGTTAANRVMTSPDGVNWTSRTASGNLNWGGVDWSPQLSKFVAVGYSGSNKVMTSPDGINWTGHTSISDSSSQWVCVRWISQLSLFIAIATNSGLTSNMIMTSPDGITWTGQASPNDSNGGWVNSTWAPELGIFVSVADRGSTTNRVMTSKPLDSSQQYLNIYGRNAIQSVLGNINLAGNVGIGTSTPTLGPLTMASGAYVTAGGVWTNASDRNLKENFATVTPIDILQKINQLPIPQWNYKNEDASIKHIGPIAQDFYSIFQVGNSSTSISTIDPAGVALLGIQALDQKITALQGSLNGNATTSNLTVYSPSNFSGDSVGEAKILAGATSVRVTFSQAYKYEPIVTVTPINFDGKWKLNNVDSTGFTIEYSDVQPLPSDLYFNWHSFASPNAKLTVSDGTTSAIELVVINKIQNNPVPIIVPVADENNNSTSTPKAEQVLGDATSTSTSDVTPSTPETLSTPTPVQSPETIVPPENPTP